MAGTPPEDLLAWLEREEENLGFTSVEEALTDIQKARVAFFKELGYEMKEEQFEGLKSALYSRYEEFPSISIEYGRIEQKWGYQPVYRDVITGRFVSGSDVRALLEQLRAT